MSSTLIPKLQSKDELHVQPTFNARRMGRGELAKKPLTAEDYHRLREKFDSITVEKPDAETTKRNIVAVQDKWKRYCDMMRKGDPSAALLKCSKGDCMAFLTWICETYNISKKRQKYDSVSVSWRAFKMLFARCTGYPMNANAKKEVSDFLAGVLKKRYKLDTSVKPKPVISADDLLVLLCYLWASYDSVMPDEEQRVQLATILLFAAFTGSRPAELVDASLSAKDKKKIKDVFWRKTTPWDNPDDSDYEGGIDLLKRAKSLCWEDIELRIVALNNGRIVRVIWITFTHHKGVDRKPLPTIFCFTEEEQPIFDPIAHLITLAL